MQAESLVFDFHQNGDTRDHSDVKPRIAEENNDKLKTWKVSEINEPPQCRSLKLPEHSKVAKVWCLLILCIHLLHQSW